MTGLHCHLAVCFTPSRSRETCAHSHAGQYMGVPPLKSRLQSTTCPSSAHNRKASPATGVRRSEGLDGRLQRRGLAVAAPGIAGDFRLGTVVRLVDRVTVVGWTFRREDDGRRNKGQLGEELSLFLVQVGGDILFLWKIDGLSLKRKAFAGAWNVPESNTHSHSLPATAKEWTFSIRW